MSTKLILFAWLIFVLLGMATAAWWLARLWQRRRALATWLKVVSGAAGMVGLFGALGALNGLTRVFGVVTGGSADPSQRALVGFDPSELARLLAEGIADAINCSALALLAWVPTFIVTALATRRSQLRSHDEIGTEDRHNSSD